MMFDDLTYAELSDAMMKQAWKLSETMLTGDQEEIAKDMALYKSYADECNHRRAIEYPDK